MATITDHTFLGLDLGTSELKALLIDAQQQVIASVGAKLTVQRPHPLWSEQSPMQWWTALEAVMDQLKHEHSAALHRVAGIGLSGQMHGAVLLDEQSQVLRPAILWNDGRSGSECKSLHDLVPDLSRITGNLAMPGFTAPKLLWVRAHEPECFAQTRKVLLPKDWLRLKLSGEAVSDMSDAAGTLWLDTGRRAWSQAMLEACGLTEAHMPRLVEGSAISSHLLPEWSARWGLPKDVPIAGGAGDNAASAVGMGLVKPGQGFVSLGTSGVVFVCGESFAPNPEQAVHAFCHALPNSWHQMSVMLSAASAVTWATRLLGFGHEGELIHAASTLDDGGRTRAPVFLPYLSGERSPLNNPLATGSWQGLTSHHERADLAYAVAEGVGFGLLDGMLTLQGNQQLKALSLVGGGARSGWWAQLLADTFNVSLNVHSGAETGAALGAARLGYLAAGESIEAVCSVPDIAQTYVPQASAHKALQARFDRFHQLRRWISPSYALG